jgi:Holliday junction resolvase RusA-like endonuclease
MPELTLEIPGCPPTANHYKTYRIVTPRGRKPVAIWYLTSEAKAWYASVAAIAQGRYLRGSEYMITYTVYFPDARRRDGDNLDKCLYDSLTQAGVIHDDSAVVEGHRYVRIDRVNPRTVITISARQEQMYA